MKHVNCVHFCILLSIFHTVSSIDNNTQKDQSNSSKRNASAVNPVLKRVATDVFSSLNRDHRLNVLDIFYQSEKESIRSRLHRLDSCYLSTVKKGTEMKLFEDSLAVLVDKYLLAFYPLLEEAFKAENVTESLRAKIHNLVSSIQSISKLVVQCLMDLDDPDFEPSKLTFNYFSLKSAQEIQATRQRLPHLPPTSLLEHQNKIIQITKLNHTKLGATGKKVENGTGNHYPNGSFFDVSDVSEADLPLSFDYRNQSVVGDIKDQSSAGTCYAFASLAAMESSYMLLLRGAGKLAPGQVVNFSEMDTVNCLIKLGYIKDANDAFDYGGSLELILLQLYNKDYKGNKLGGVKLDKDAPPYNTDKFNGELCDHSNHSQEIVQVVHFYTTSINLSAESLSLTYLKMILFKYGPLTVSYGCPDYNIDLYVSFLAGEQNRACNLTNPVPAMQNHAMLLVGWTPKYLIIKNSWSFDWGIDGYLYLNIKHLLNCGVIGEGSHVSFPVVREVNSKTVRNNLFKKIL